MLAQIGKLRVYAGDATNGLLNELRSALYEDRRMEAERARELSEQLKSGQADWVNAWTEVPEKPSREAYGAVESKCRSVMLGESVGFL